MELRSTRRALAFNPAPPPTTQEVSELLTTARKRILRHLGKHGLLDDDHSGVEPLGEQASLLANCYVTSVARRQTLGPRPGAPLDCIGRDPHAQWQERNGELQAHIEGFDLHARLTIATEQPGDNCCAKASPLLRSTRIGERPAERFARRASCPDRMTCLLGLAN